MSILQNQFDEITIKAYELRTEGKYDEALKLIQPFADKGLAVAQHIIGTFHYFGESVPIDLVKASEWFHKAADQECPESLSMLGHQYLYGVGIPRDEEKGIDLLIRASNKSNGYACYLLGRYYQAKKDRFKASGFYVLGINLESRDCMRGRAHMHMETKNYKEALDLYVQALKLGCIESTFNAATMFDNGLGCEQNLELAFMLYQAAAKSNDLMAIHNLGTFYYNGKHVAQDKKKAFEYYLQAAEMGAGISQHCIGLMYYNGDLEQDLDVALAWMKKSIENGYSDSAKYITEIEKVKEKRFVEH